MLICEICGNIAKFACSNCRNAFYCSIDKQCQKKHWIFHKKLCNEIKPAPLIDDIKFIELLGKGAIGQVWKGTQKINGEEIDVAIKLIKLYDDNLEDSILINLIKSFLSEVSIHEIIRNNNSNLCESVLVCKTKYEPNFFVTNNLKGIIIFPFETAQTLSNLIKNGNIDNNSLKNMFIDLLKDISRLHSMGISHLDIKPDNILVSQDKKRALLIDFGLSCSDDENFIQIENKFFNLKTDISKKFSENENTKNKAVLIKDIKELSLKDVISCKIDRGTPNYIDPSLYNKQNSKDFIISPLADLYAVAVTMFESFTGKLLNNNNSDFKNFKESLLELSEENPSVISFMALTRFYINVNINEIDNTNVEEAIKIMISEKKKSSYTKQDIEELTKNIIYLLENAKFD